MWTFYVTVFVICPLLVATENNFLNEYSNGWTPVSSETIYNQIRREGSIRPHYTPHNVQAIHTDINELIAPANTVKTEEIAAHAKENGETYDYRCHSNDSVVCNKLANKPDEQAKNEFLTPNNSHYSFAQISNGTEYTPVRRSKKIAKFNGNNDHRYKLLAENHPLKNEERTYEVTENVLEKDESNTKNQEYTYEPPKNRNQTNVLLEILSKYKINKDDELPNYILSRKVRTRIPLKVLYEPVNPIQNQALYKYNNANHLPVDPLIAVFLSNYGFYLQGLYGRNNRYNNLYGYLASNNMHNNRPFGFYKIFSDTDSSH